MRTSRQGCLWLLLAGLVLLGPAAPSAMGSSIDLSLPASNGYRLNIFALSGTPVTAVFSKAVSDGVVYAEYSVDGTVGRDRLMADFGPYGRISVRFPGRRPPQRNCRHGHSIERSRRFVGTIRFRGDQGFSAVSATSAKGSLERSCETSGGRPAAARPSSLRRTKEFLTSFVAVSRSEGRSITLLDEAFSRRPPGEASSKSDGSTLVEVEEERGRISVERTAIVTSRPIASTPFGTAPITASVTLPQPFSGVGSYLEEANSPTSWTGDLQVDLPGAENVPLTGPDFTTHLCRGRNGDPELLRCLRENPKLP
jgi:hypothetical protein